MTSSETQVWSLLPGSKILRKELHNLYGGNRQSGIAACKNSPNILIFSDLKAGEKHGYVMDGWKDDGCFHYTGAGRVGDQEFKDGNLAIRDSAQDKNTLRVFQGVGGKVTYLGAFYLDHEEPYYYAEAPSANNGPIRQVIAFRMRPEGEHSRLGETPSSIVHFSDAAVVDAVPIEEHNVEIFSVSHSEGERLAERKESELVSDFKKYLLSQNIDDVIRLKITPRGEASPLYSDIYIPSRSLLVEAKSSVTRASIRMAIGQLFDYRRFAKVDRLAILVPMRPRADLIELLSGLGIEVFWRDGSKFRMEI